MRGTTSILPPTWRSIARSWWSMTRTSSIDAMISARRCAWSMSRTSTLTSRIERSAPIEIVWMSPMSPSPSAIARQTRASMPVRWGCSMR